ASSDLLTMTISNRVSLILVAGFFALALVGGMSAAEVLAHAGAGMIVLVMAFVCFVRGWLGGGDAKLAAATALWLGFDYLFDYLLKSPARPRIGPVPRGSCDSSCRSVIVESEAYETRAYRRSCDRPRCRRHRGLARRSIGPDAPRPSARRPARNGRHPDRQCRYRQ